MARLGRGPMAYMNDCAPAFATTVLTTDRQTGLPTLIRFCVDLQALLDRHVSLALVIFSLDGAPHSPLGSNGEHAHDPATLAAQFAIEAIKPYPHARVYRTAADSFGIVLPATGRPAAAQLAEGLRRRIEQAGLGATATFAVAGAPHDAGDVGSLIAVCEVQLLVGPEGRNRVYTVTPVESLPPAAARLADLLVSRLVALVELSHQLDETQHQALHDPISKLPNSRSLEQALPRYLERCARAGTPLALLLVDGDNLKQFNTALGYQAGNDWIERIARTLEANVRPGDYVARWLAGDEFIVLLPDTGSNQAIEIADRLRIAVETSSDASGYGTISVGIAIAQGQPVLPESLLESAREALLQAKRHGKNQVALLVAG